MRLRRYLGGIAVSIFIYCNPPNALLSKKAITRQRYELSIHLNTSYISFALVRVLRAGAFCCSQKFFQKLCFSIWHRHGTSVEGSRKGINNPPPGTRGGENMDYPARFEWQTRCEFNAYCKRTLRNELIDACRERKSRKRHEVSFADLTPHEEKQLYTVDRYFVNEDEEAFCAGGLKITAKLLAEALHSLPDEKRQAVLLYYFFDMTDVEIAELMKVPRSTVQYRRTSSFELLKRYLEERADEWDEL